MSLVEVRQEIVDKLEELDENMLMAIHTIVHRSTNKQEEVVGYEVDGTPIHVNDFLEDATEQLDEVRKGNYTTLEDHKKETEAWLKSIH